MGSSRNFTLSSDPLTGKWGSGTNALLAPLVFKTLLAVVDLGQCGGTQSGKNTEFRQNCWVPEDGWGIPFGTSRDEGYLWVAGQLCIKTEKVSEHIIGVLTVSRGNFKLGFHSRLHSVNFCPSKDSLYLL